MEEVSINITDSPDNIFINVTDNIDHLNFTITDSPDTLEVSIDNDTPEMVSITVLEAPSELITINISEGSQGPQGPPGQPPVITHNIEVEDLSNESNITHPLNSWKIAVLFFDANGRQIFNIDWEVLDQFTIKIYLPIIDGELVPFTGDIFIINRN